VGFLCSYGTQISTRLNFELNSQLGLAQSIGSQHYLRKTLFNAGSLEISVYLSDIPQHSIHVGYIAPPEIKLIADLRVSMVTFNNEFHLLKVGEGLEGKIRRS
jgi:hypothetical protein